MNYNLFSLYHSCCSYIFGHFLVCIFVHLFSLYDHLNHIMLLFMFAFTKKLSLDDSPLLHIKITHFDSVASVVITKVASVAFCSQGRKCRMLLTSVASVKKAYCHDAYVVPITT
jgi:hypothetical protein